MDIGKIISNRRKELGLTLEEVGKSVGVGKSTVLKWENGYISNMRRDKIALLAKVLKMNPTELLGDEEHNDYDNTIVLSEHEKELIIAYRSNSAMQSAVDKLLNVPASGISIAEDISETIRKIESVSKADISKK